MDADIFEEIQRLRREGRKAVLATIVQIRGSVPSFQTAQMLVLVRLFALWTPISSRKYSACDAKDARRFWLQSSRSEAPFPVFRRPRCWFLLDSSPYGRLYLRGNTALATRRTQGGSGYNRPDPRLRSQFSDGQDAGS